MGRLQAANRTQGLKWNTWHVSGSLLTSRCVTLQMFQPAVALSSNQNMTKHHKTTLCVWHNTHNTHSVHFPGPTDRLILNTVSTLSIHKGQRDRRFSYRRHAKKSFRNVSFISPWWSSEIETFCPVRAGRSGSPSLGTDSLPVLREHAVCRDCVELELALAGQELALFWAGDRHNQLVHIGHQIAPARGLVITTRPSWRN